MKFLKNKPIRIEGLNDLYSGKIMKTDNYNDHSFNYEVQGSFDYVVLKLNEYIGKEKEKEIIEKKAKEERLKTIEGKREDKINEILGVLNIPFERIDFVKFVNQQFYELFMDDDFKEEYNHKENTIHHTDVPIWTKKAEIKFDKFLKEMSEAKKRVINNLNIKDFNMSINDILLFGNLPEYGLNYYYEDYYSNDFQNKLKEKTKQFIISIIL